MTIALRAPCFQHGLSSEPLIMPKAHQRIDYLPTPEEIAREASRIRSEWTLHERQRREGRPSPRGEVRLGRIVSAPFSLRDIL